MSKKTNPVVIEHNTVSAVRKMADALVAGDHISQEGTVTLDSTYTELLEARYVEPTPANRLTVDTLTNVTTAHPIGQPGNLITYVAQLVHQEKTREAVSITQHAHKKGLEYSQQVIIESLDAAHKKHNDDMEILMAAITDKEDLRIVKQAYEDQLAIQQRTKELLVINQRARMNDLLHSQQATIESSAIVHE